MTEKLPKIPLQIGGAKARRVVGATLSSPLSAEPDSLSSAEGTAESSLLSAAVQTLTGPKMAGNDVQSPNPNHNPNDQNRGAKRKRNLPGNPDPDAEIIALSPKTLMSATAFLCDVCGKEFRRDQNLQIHRRGHNLPWKFPAKSCSAGGGGKDGRKRAYVCPEVSCVYHEPSRALGDLTGIKKHYNRKHGEKTWECDKCSKKYAVRTDWKAHGRICGNREYECRCGTLFSRKESLAIHRASCEGSATAEESDDEYPSSATVAVRSVNSELLFPSLWGQAAPPAPAVEEEPRGKKGVL